MALAMSNNKVAVLLVFCLFLIISSTESRQLGTGNGKPSCDFTYAVKPADTCADVIEDFALDSDFFFSINPNINCDALFVDQWLCVSGSA
ncbi:putative LysM domain-containing protein [Rosa chinensis]|uniref:Putative LysM domain-containing protein n=1 Tax=Rosa chinensis TaxID=74649 RepID=A0A2P6S2W4_ROSCH|nr:putative LysM domain-containing protein [Rosa chinensis]